MERNKIVFVIIIAIIALFILGFGIWLHWYGISEGQSTLSIYPITLYPNGSGTSSVSEYIDKTLIDNAAHLTEKDFSEHPALGEVFAGERSVTRGFSKVGGVENGEEMIYWNKYHISEYEENYYVLLVALQ